MRTCLKYRRAGRPVMLVLALVPLCGCPAVSSLSAPGEVRVQQDPVFGREYLLYAPSYYRDDRDWMLVVTCHGTKPFDTARLQIDTWKGLAEKEGFLVAAPELIGTSGVIRPDPDEQLHRQARDEEAILAAVGAIKASRSVDPTRVFITCWSAGGFATLYTGLRSPDVFRAVSIYQGNFDARFVEPCVPFIDPYQPVQVVYGNLDPLDDTQACISWLLGQGIDPVVRELPGTHRRRPDPVYDFFRQVSRKVPWIRLQVEDDPVDPMTVRFRTRTSFTPRRHRWDFGDDTGSLEARPEHTYTKPGNYKVRVAVWPEKGDPEIRGIELPVPRPRIGVRPETRPADRDTSP